jgi:hypothetical protein
MHACVVHDETLVFLVSSVSLVLQDLSESHASHLLSFLNDRINQVKPKTETEARVYEALSHKNWGSSSTLMNEIARDTYDYDKCK